MNTTLGGLSGNEVARTFFFVGTPQDLMAHRPTLTGHALYDRISRGFLGDALAGLRGFDAPPVVLRLDVDNQSAPAAAPGTLQQLAPGVSVVVGQGLAPFSADAAAVASKAASAEARKLRDHPSPFADPGHLLRNIVGLFLLLVLPGLLAARWFGVRGLPERLALVPGLSIALVLTAGVLVIAVHRAPVGPADGWVALALAVAAGLGLHLLARARPRLAAGDDAPSGVVVVPEANGDGRPASRSQ
jgi:hypothetical protein